MLLEHFGYKVLPTSSVEEAKTVAEGSCPDMLLMDNSHPGIASEQVAEQVKKVCPHHARRGAISLLRVWPGSLGCVDGFVAKDDGPKRPDCPD